MNEIPTIVDGDRMTSLQIAEITGKPHADVMKAIRKMEPAWSKINEGNFSLVEYKDKKGETRPCYSLTKEECLYIATKFNDEARAKLIKRWKELEEQHQKPSLPQNYLEALKSLVKAEEEREQLALENRKQQQEIVTISKENMEQDYRNAAKGKLLRPNPAKQCHHDHHSDSTGLRNECGEDE